MTNTSYFQPPIDPLPALGESAFRFQRVKPMIQIYAPPNPQRASLTFAVNLPFAPMASEDLATNRNRTVQHTARLRRILPIVTSTGRLITEQEIEDALAD